MPCRLCHASGLTNVPSCHPPSSPHSHEWRNADAMLCHYALGDGDDDRPFHCRLLTCPLLLPRTMSSFQRLSKAAGVLLAHQLAGGCTGGRLVSWEAGKCQVYLPTRGSERNSDRPHSPPFTHRPLTPLHTLDIFILFHTCCLKSLIHNSHMLGLSH